MELILIAIIIAPRVFSLITKLNDLGKCRRCKRRKKCPAGHDIDSRDYLGYYIPFTTDVIIKAA